MKLGLIQMNSIDDLDANLAEATRLIEQCVDLEGPDWICLPETWNWAGGRRADKLAAADTVPGGRAYTMAQELAARHKVWLHAGSILERAADAEHVHNTTVVFDRTGREIAVYRKIHMFDITLPDGTTYRESDSVAAGRQIVTYDCEGLTVGCAICYDLRFPELFQALAREGADLIALPSAFTLATGKDHWDVLCRARAIETQTYFAAPGQCGTFPGPDGKRRPTYGHSLIADPWGHIISKASDGPGFVTARLDMAFLDRCRAQIPVAEHKVLGRDMPW